MNKDDLWDEMNGFRFSGVQLLFHIIELPGHPTVFTRQGALLSLQHKRIFFDRGFFGFCKFVECEEEDFFFNLLQLTDVDRDLRD